MKLDAEASDTTLARLAAAGDDQAFNLLVRRHKESLYRLLRRYTGDADEAYEAVHEAFIAAWGALRRYDPERSFGAWLRTIAINKARDRGRRMAVRRMIFGVQSLEDSPAMEAFDPATAADDLVILDQRARRLGKAVAKLSDSLKAPLLLTAFEGYSQQEAGEILGLSTKTIETRVYRARKILAAQLGDDMRPSKG
ncbi:RNA polymerase sigma factor [Phenylobacterium sp. 58.2.17]|uniref:RNA polymerase sigma factor n=1 Tax=Phenylobacterium sp. 58.2.17 TaxID=2969306 RepID=UPI002264FAEA|nr:RNA polymerase sigma factor [Phenylobacterium sp. 58.2.17]MCX7587784.1 RNA polymerase sigma factor [Phenylobacterium sp. 58.2.17]